ncbi:phenylalanine--tRNA ligase subunit beta [Piscinibacter sakaiensis]|uniref:Phenylalanine--tRNA ligase beta subunit n=1 Tax=Piscinibacter sakaiensis TaxID=1547922 RepID=A0A0K8P3T7_PISS1|nr:phenylalanine--tRNA ligase subunit beta [Piscinibacter sakaiensis]GAP37308.1 phenylalanyl-tRNA synthetase, beta chain [Piscinibacter sakaiensis]
MQFPESWLREYCNPPLSTQALADLLTMSGMEVEELRPVAPPFSGVVVGAVLAVEPHPNADRLRVCQVDVGAAAPLRIVCGAPNARAGIKVPCARVGAKLPGEGGDDAPPFEIRLGRLRGVDSEGMLCSARELRLSEDHGGLLELAAEAPVGTDVRDWLRLDDTLFTLKLTPNLGHALSVQGIAREVSALTGTPLTLPATAPVAPGHDDRLPVRVEAPDLCGRFSGRIVRGVNPQARTPDWMVERLARCGQRPVSPLVDISNYVMFETGQPSHIFDLARIHGGLSVRWGRDGETLKLLNGQTITVDGQVGVIADERAVESLAGIMGGDATAVGDATRDIYIEAAFWWPAAVAGRSRRYAFSTDAGHRFERGVDAARTVAVIERITALVQAICGGSAGPVDDQVLALPARPPVRLRVDRAAKVIGMPVDAAACRGVMERLGFPVTEATVDGAAVLEVTPPSWRFDLAIEEDLIEEVVRVLGYDRLPDTPPRAALQPRVRSERRRGVHALRQAVAERGYVETINYSFVEARWEQELAGNPDPIRVLNPIASPLSVMRSSLVGSLVQVLRSNLARKAPRVRVFEIGRVFLRDASVADGPVEVAGLRQPLRLGGLAYGSAVAEQWGERARPVDFHDVKGDVEALFGPRAVRFVAAEHPALHPGRCARIERDGQPVGVIGELHPRWRQAYELPAAPILFELALPALLEGELPAFVPLPRQQSIRRDLALVVPDGIGHDRLVDTARAAPTPLLREVRLFDVYKPAAAGGDLAPGERSMALHLTLRDDEGTPTDERIEAAVAEVLDHLRAQLGVRLRG